MKSNETGVEHLYTLAEELMDAGLPLDVVNVEIGEKAVPRTDKTVVRTLIQAYGDGDLVIPLGKLADGSALIALEVDRAKGGDESFKRLWKNSPILPTPIVQPVEGPLYFLMHFCGTPRNSRVELGPGLALVSDGHYIVVPSKDDPERSTGWWKNFPADVDVAPVPDKLASLL